MVNFTKRFAWPSLLLVICLFAGCGKDDGPKEPNVPGSLQENTFIMAGSKYTLNNGKYFTGMYPYMGLECTNFYLECSRGSGLTIELDEKLVGKTVYFEPGDTFWFFAIGNGNKTYVPMQHDSEHVVWGDWYREGEDYSGWFRLTRDLDTDECTLVFSINKNDVQGWAMGKFKATFSRLTSL